MKIIKYLIALSIVPLMVSCGGSGCSERVAFGIIANNLCGPNESSQKQIENNKIKNGASSSSAGVLISF
jgi:hypothetical protein